MMNLDAVRQQSELQNYEHAVRNNKGSNVGRAESAQLGLCQCRAKTVGSPGVG